MGSAGIWGAYDNWVQAAQDVVIAVVVLALVVGS